MALAVALALVFGGCGDEADPVAETPTPEATRGAPVGPGPLDWERDYETPDAMLEELLDSGVECETEGGSFSTVYSERSLFCYTVPTRDEGYTFSVYASGEQQGEAHAMLTAQNPGTDYVWGTGWSVAVPYGSDGSEVVAALGGEVG